MADLDFVKASLRSYRSQLAAKKAEKQSYLNTAADIGAIYDRMVEDKELIKGYRSSVETFLKEEFDNFTGNLYSATYKVRLEALIDDYDLVINNIDTNMDRLNTARAQYENKAYKCNGTIGYLQSSINSLVHTIENWVN
jgi:hypothetical protein